MCEALPCADCLTVNIIRYIIKFLKVYVLVIREIEAISTVANGVQPMATLFSPIAPTFLQLQKSNFKHQTHVETETIFGGF